MSESSATRVTKIAELRPNRSGLVVEFKVLKVEKPRTVTGRGDGASHRVSEVLVGDETGCILLTLWDDEIAKAQEGRVLRLVGGRTGFFQGRLRLRLGRGGSLQPCGRDISRVNRQRNLSAARRGGASGQRRREQTRSHPPRRTKGFKWIRIKKEDSH